MKRFLSLIFFSLIIITGCSKNGSGDNVKTSTNVSINIDVTAINQPDQTPENFSPSDESLQQLQKVIMESYPLSTNTIFAQVLALNAYVGIPVNSIQSDLPWQVIKPEQWLSFASEPDLGRSYISFANHKPYLLVVTQTGDLWITDKQYTYKHHIARFEKFRMDALLIQWTADDALAFINTGEDNFLFDMNTGNLQKWHFRCSELVLLDESHSLAVKCIHNEKDDYAIILWGGEIIYSEEVPISYQSIIDVENTNDKFSLVRNIAFPLAYFAGWSIDGQTLAYFEIDSGSLIVMDSSGKKIGEYKNRAYWVAHNNPIIPIKWTNQPSKFLVFSAGNRDNPCMEIDLAGEVIAQPACWHFVDFATGRFEVPYYKIDDKYQIIPSVTNVTISPNGEFISFSDRVNGENNFVIINNTTHEVLGRYNFLVFTSTWE